MTARKRHRQQQSHHTQNQQQQQLHNAARNGDVAEVARLLSLGDGTVDVNARDRHSRTALHLAAWAGHADVVRLLCTSGGAAVNAAATDDTTALHFAAQKGHVAAVKALLAAGAKVSSRTRRGQTALHLAAAAAAATAAAPAAPAASGAAGSEENVEGETAAADAKPAAAEHSEPEAAERAEETEELDEERRKELGGSEGRPHGKPDERGDREGGAEPGHAAAAADPAVSSDPREVPVSGAAAAHAVVAAAEEGSDVTGHVGCNEAARVCGAESLSEGEQRFADVIQVLVKKAGSAGSGSALDLLSAMTSKGETASDLAKSPRIRELLQQLTLQQQVQQSSKQDKKHGKEGQQQQHQQRQQKQQQQHEGELEEQASLSRRMEEDLTEGKGLIKHSSGEPHSVTTKAEIALEEEETTVRKQGYGDVAVQTDSVIGPTSTSASGSDVDAEADVKGKESEERSRSREGKKAKVSLSHLDVEDDFEER